MSEAVPSPEAARRPVVIVAGMSGAGRTTAVSALEDLGFEALNNFPLGLIGRVVEGGEGEPRPLAIGVETRTRGFSARTLGEILDRLRADEPRSAVLLFLDAEDRVLADRFAATRRPHPLAPAEAPEAGIARERTILAPIRARADLVIDTSQLSPHALRAQIASYFPAAQPAGPMVALQSFSYKRGAPHDAAMVFDCRALANPYWDETLRGLDGRDPRIQGFVRADPRFAPFFGALRSLLEVVLSASRAEGRAYVSVAFGCTGGRHRSVALAEMTAAELRREGWPVILRHREIEAEQAAASVAAERE